MVSDSRQARRENVRLPHLQKEGEIPMKHPFTKLLYTALKKSSVTDNVVLAEAEKLKEKGYSVIEIHSVLTKLGKGLIDKTENEIVAEAVEEFGRYLEDQEDEE